MLVTLCRSNTAHQKFTSYPPTMDFLLIFVPRVLSTNTLIVLFPIQCHFKIKKSACPSLPRTFSILALEIPGPRNPSFPRQLGAAGQPAASERSVRPADCFWEMMTHLFWDETYLWHQTDVGFNPLSITYHLDETLDTSLNFSEAQILVYKSQ